MSSRKIWKQLSLRSSSSATQSPNDECESMASGGLEAVTAFNSTTSAEIDPQGASYASGYREVPARVKPTFSSDSTPEDRYQRCMDHNTTPIRYRDIHRQGLGNLEIFTRNKFSSTLQNPTKDGEFSGLHIGSSIQYDPVLDSHLPAAWGEVISQAAAEELFRRTAFQAQSRRLDRRTVNALRRGRVLTLLDTCKGIPAKSFNDFRVSALVTVLDLELDKHFADTEFLARYVDSTNSEDVLGLSVAEWQQEERSVRRAMEKVSNFVVRKN